MSEHQRPARGKPQGRPAGKGKPAGKGHAKPTAKGKPQGKGKPHGNMPQGKGRPARRDDWKRPSDKQGPRTKDQERYDGPELPEEITGAELDRSISAQLKGLP